MCIPIPTAITKHSSSTYKQNNEQNKTSNETKSLKSYLKMTAERSLELEENTVNEVIDVCAR